eukprot:251960-Chlamydomonas_euryale.AAC.1
MQRAAIALAHAGAHAASGGEGKATPPSPSASRPLPCSVSGFSWPHLLGRVVGVHFVTACCRLGHRRASDSLRHGGATGMVAG